jgi:hypothetical protein
MIATVNPLLVVISMPRVRYHMLPGAHAAADAV